MRRLVYGLLFAQLIVFVYILALTMTTPTGHVIAQGGHITQVELSPTTQWTGVYGDLTAAGTDTLTLTRQTIVQHDILYDDTLNECKRTELFAATTSIQAEDITPITPQQADLILGYGNNPFSVTQMFTIQETYDLAGTQVALWSTTSNGQLTQFVQGVGQVNGTLVFVTKTVRNGRAYNNAEATYQFLLPAGAWSVSYDETDECTLLNEYDNQTISTADMRLDVSVDSRVCVNQENRFAGVLVRDRTFCRPHEWGNVYCQIAQQAELAVRKDGVDVPTTVTEGVAVFSLAEPGQYFLTATTTNQTATRLVSAQYCLDNSIQDAPEQTINYTRTEVELGEFAELPEYQEPSTEEQLEAAYLLLSTLTISIILLSLFVFYHVRKDTSEALLKLRIWLLELRK